jgi:hypothetical protein
MASVLKKTNKADTKISENKEIKKLSKVGEWLRSGQSIGGVYDIKAILK